MIPKIKCTICKTRTSLEQTQTSVQKIPGGAEGREKLQQRPLITNLPLCVKFGTKLMGIRIKVKFSLILTVMYYINMYFVTRILSLKAKFSLILVAIKVKFEFGTLRPVAFSCCHYCVQFVYANLEILSNLFIQY